MPSFGNSSSLKLRSCSSNIQFLLGETIKVIDFSVLTGHRNREEQNALYPKYTKLRWPKGKHNSFPSKAVDVAPYIKPYGVLTGSDQQIKEIRKITKCSYRQANDFVIKAYARLIGYIECMSYVHGISIRTGIDWDGDFDMLDQSFHDLGHIEEKQ